MSDANDVLKSFLVSVGFSVDEASRAKLQKGLQAVTVQAVALGDVMAKVAESVAKGIVQMATAMDELYFTSRRVNAAAENIRAFSLAIRQMGGTAQGASSALEGIASFMRGTPQGESFIQSLGVATRDSNGHLRDFVDLLTDLGRVFKGMPFWAAKARAQMLGIDERTLLSLEQDPQALKREEEKINAFARSIGLGMDGGADASNRFMTSIRDLQTELGLLIVAAGTKLLPILQSIADWFERIAENADDLKQAQLGQSFIQMGNAAGQLFDALVQLAKGYAHLQVVGSAFNMMIGVASATFNILGGIIRSVADLLQGKWAQAWADAGKTVKSFADYVVGLFRAVTRAAEEMWYSATHRGAAMPGGDQPIDGAPVGTPAAKPKGNVEGPADGTAPPIVGNRSTGHQPLSVRDNNPGNLVDTRTGRFRHFDTPEQGIAAMRAQVIRDYFVHGLHNLRQLINDRLHGWSNEWAPGNSHAGSMNYVAALAKALRIGVNDNINMRDPTVLSRLMAAMARHESGGSYFDQYFTAAPLMSAGAAHYQSVSSKTDIHMSVVGDPSAAGRAVATSMDRVNGDLIRSLKPTLA